jgi:hypothetical protein
LQRNRKEETKEYGAATNSNLCPNALPKKGKQKIFSKFQTILQIRLPVKLLTIQRLNVICIIQGPGEIPEDFAKQL